MKKSENFSKMVSEFFDGYSSKWDSLYGKKRKSDPLSIFADEVLRKVIKRRLSTTMSLSNVSRIQTVLDAGCGSGQYLVEFARLGKKVTGMDFAQSMLEISSSTLAEQKITSVELVLGDFNDYNFGNQKFDLVCAMGFFDYQPNAESSLQKMCLVAKEEVYASFPKSKGLLAIQRRIKYKWRKCPLWLYNKESIVTMVNRCVNVKEFELIDLGRDWILRIQVQN